jgi:hypothetical protein
MGMPPRSFLQRAAAGRSPLTVHPDSLRRPLLRSSLPSSGLQEPQVTVSCWIYPFGTLVVLLACRKIRSPTTSFPH